MNILGISAGFHDAGVCLIKDGDILFAGHAERYSKKKHDEHINSEIIKEAISYGIPDQIVADYIKTVAVSKRGMGPGNITDFRG